MGVENLGEFDGKSFQDAGRSDLELPKSDDDAEAPEDSEDASALLEKIKTTLEDRVEAVNLSHRLVDSAGLCGYRAAGPAAAGSPDARGERPGDT